jgi:hypothetical protein
MDENSDGQSVISVRQEECSSTLGVTLARPPMVVALDDADVTVVALHVPPSLSGLGESCCG